MCFFITLILKLSYNKWQKIAIDMRIRRCNMYIKYQKRKIEMKNKISDEFVKGSNPDIDIEMTRLAIDTAHKRIDESIKQYKDIGEVIDKSDVYLRIGITGGGCSGFRYDILTEAGCNEETCAVTSFDGVNVAVDFITYPYLEGAKIRFDANEIIPDAGNFSVVNPNWSDTCSCGESFSV